MYCIGFRINIKFQIRDATFIGYIDMTSNRIQQMAEIGIKSCSGMHRYKRKRTDRLES